MSWTLAQGWTRQQTGSSTTRVNTMGSPPTTGNLIVCVFLYSDAGSTNCHVSIADGNSNAFTATTGSPNLSDPINSGQIGIYYLTVPASPSQAITATFDALSGGAATLWTAEYAPSSGANGGLDTGLAGTGASGTALNTPTLTVNQANDLCICAAVSEHQVSSVDSPWTQRAAGTGNTFSEGIGDILARGTNVTVAMTQNVSSAWVSLAAGFIFTTGGATAALSATATLSTAQAVKATATLSANASLTATVQTISANLSATTSLTVSTINDADYIQSPITPVFNEQRFRLGPLSPPANNSGIRLKYHYRKDLPLGNAIDLTTTLYAADGVTVITSQFQHDIPSTVTDGTIFLLDSEAATIPSGDWATGLVVGFKANEPAGPQILAAYASMTTSP